MIARGQHCWVASSGDLIWREKRRTLFLQQVSNWKTYGPTDFRNAMTNGVQLELQPTFSPKRSFCSIKSWCRVFKKCRWHFSVHFDRKKKKKTHQNSMTAAPPSEVDINFCCCPAQMRRSGCWHLQQKGRRGPSAFITCHTKKKFLESFVTGSYSITTLNLGSTFSFFGRGAISVKPFQKMLPALRVEMCHWVSMTR